VRSGNHRKAHRRRRSAEGKKEAAAAMEERVVRVLGEGNSFLKEKKEGERLAGGPREEARGRRGLRLTGGPRVDGKKENDGSTSKFKN
jgi:hypothetical protein